MKVRVHPYNAYIRLPSDEHYSAEFDGQRIFVYVDATQISFVTPIPNGCIFRADGISYATDESQNSFRRRAVLCGAEQLREPGDESSADGARNEPGSQVTGSPERSIASADFPSTHPRPYLSRDQWRQICLAVTSQYRGNGRPSYQLILNAIEDSFVLEELRAENEA